MKLKAFREGEVIPNDARYVRSEKRKVGHGHMIELPGTGLLGFLGITCRDAIVYDTEIVDIYEVPE